MRSRPSVQLFLRPGVGRAGQDLHVEAVLASKSETPVDAIEITLRGVERVIVGSGNHASVQERQHVGQRATFGARKLLPGEHRCSVKFHVAEDAPASYRGSYVSIDYEVEVYVKIPWWPDRRVRFEIPVARAVPPPPPPTPRVFATHGEGPRGKEPYVEVSLDDVRMEASGTVSGAVSFGNVAHARISHVELAFVATEVVRLSVQDDEHRYESRAWKTTILDRAPHEAESIAFRVRVPDDAPAAFSAALSRIEWHLHAIGHVTLGRDVKLEVPIEIRAPMSEGPARRRLTAVPPVGRERRAQVWAAAAAKLGLESDPEREQMRTSFGAASVILRLEHRDGIGLLGVAELSWTPLGLDLEVRQRRWTDAFGGTEVVIPHPAFAKRFHVVARPEDEVRSSVSLVLDEPVRRTLDLFDDVEIDDEGAVLARRCSVQSAEALTLNLQQVLEGVRALGEAVARVPTVAARPYR